MKNTQQPPTREQLIQLYQHDVIDARGYHYAEATFLPDLHWRQWIFRLCLGLGTALLLLGIVFFFAYNWHAMPKWSKLALIEGAMLLCFVASFMCGMGKLLGQCLLLAGTVFIGVFFAVFGQIYQTGADAWQLFAVWSVLMLGFLWVSRFYAQWILQWSITGLAVFLYLMQTVYWGYRAEWIPIGIMAVYTLGIWGLQIALSKRCDWLNIAWLRVLTLLIAHVFWVLVAIRQLINDTAIGLFIAAAIVLGLLQWHRHKRLDLLSQVIGVATLGILAWALVCYVLINGAGFNNFVGITLLMLIVTVALSVGVYQAVIALKKAMQEPQQNAE